MLPARIVTIGASAGGVESLSALVASLPADLDAAIFVVLHIPANFVSTLPEILCKKGPLKAVHPADGDEIERGRIYVAAPDHHLLIEANRVLVTRGPKENRNRPSVDALFRSAAYSHGSRVIGIVLSGALDDGTSGLWSIKRMNGITITQDPTEASFDSMPSSALSQVEIDHCVSVHQMGALLKHLTQQALKEPTYDVANDRRKMGIEVSVAVDGDAFEKGIMDVGPLTPFTCPECQGVLVKLNEGRLNRFRCHTGHAYSTSALLSGVMEKIDESYWAAMRSLEEAAMLLEQTGKDFAKEGENKAAAVFLEHARVATEQSRLLRNTVLSSERFSGDSLLNKAGQK
ncbi:two-component system, chemotaxis family, response regulator CheB [Nitrosospira sp. Nl5]|uniref:chemotaxis protein CheB n=1 Tax=Nitrosospira sp. Nl5 TaxID=200120 RepID=UPI00088CBE3D|nr:chemotaxis protein CheB [Nitrosospira sp. Nl5]SCX95389.1 two-component system, chemotaxis family, response regulator CheB [Nitrosospira sp. Nl5]